MLIGRELRWAVFNTGSQVKLLCAVKNAEERLRVMTLLNHAIRAELAVLHEQDANYVEGLIEELEKWMDELEKAEADTS